MNFVLIKDQIEWYEAWPRSWKPEVKTVLIGERLIVTSPEWATYPIQDMYPNQVIVPNWLGHLLNLQIPKEDVVLT